jgi:hypothetical protein
MHKIEFGLAYWTGLLTRISRKFYFVFLWHLFYFLHILDIYTNFWKYKQKWKIKKQSSHSVVLASDRGPGTTALAHGHGGAAHSAHRWCPVWRGLADHDRALLGDGRNDGYTVVTHRMMDYSSYRMIGTVLKQTSSWGDGFRIRITRWEDTYLLTLA